MYTRVLHPFNLFLHKFKMLLQSHAAYCHRPHSVYGGRCVVGLSPPTPLSPSFLFGAACASRPQFLWYFSLPSLASRWIDSSYNGHYPAVTGCFNVPREFYRVAGSNSFINSCLEKVSVYVLQFAQVAKSRSPICKNSSRWCGPEFAGYDIHDFNI